MVRVPKALRRTYVVALPIALVCIAVLADEPAEKTHNVMQAKLVRTRNLIEALVSQDFQALDYEAQEMAAVTRLAAWSRDESPAYQAESFEFENTLNLLRELAKNENAKGAALACVTLTLNCVDCHQAMRAAGTVHLGDVKVPVVEVHSIGDDSNVSAWMRRKLQRTEQALAGLVTEDFKAMEQAAASMKTLGKVEAWSRRKALPRYDMLMASFNYACEELETGAREENIEAATLAYTQLLLSCVNCHIELGASGR
jgi:cytochrome c